MIIRSIFTVLSDEIRYILIGDDEVGDWSKLTNFISKKNINLSNKLSLQKDLTLQKGDDEISLLSSYLTDYIQQLLNDRPEISFIDKWFEEECVILNKKTNTKL